MKPWPIALLLVLLSLAVALPAAADEISSQLEKGLKLYEQGKIGQAVIEIEFALSQLKQKKAEALGKIFPEPPSGWTAQKPKSSSAGAGLLGGGISASRRYQDGGKGRVKIEVITDSPLIQSLAIMLSNPMFLQSGKAGRLVRLQGHKAVLKEQEERAELQALLEGKVLLRITARRVKDPGQVAQDFAAKMDLAKLKELTQ